MLKTFKAMIVNEVQKEGEAGNRFERRLTDTSLASLPDGEVLVRVRYSSVNYKDLLSVSGNRGVTRKYPHTPGIDAAGVVAESASPEFQAGDEVIVTSYDLGMNTSGGWAEYIRVPAAWVVPLPAGMTLRESMAHGTAGFTAALSVFRLTGAGVGPGDGPILVSGASGGVGSVAVCLLRGLGFRVTAINGRKDETAFLREIGADEVIGMAEAADDGGRPLCKGRWAGAVDTVGGPVLVTALKSMNYGGVVTCCGNAASPDLGMNVYPFILRGVTLIGIDSQNCPMPVRRDAWRKLATEWKVDRLEPLVSEIALDDLDQRLDLMLRGGHRGRTVVRI